MRVRSVLHHPCHYCYTLNLTVDFNRCHSTSSAQATGSSGRDTAQIPKVNNISTWVKPVSLPAQHRCESLLRSKQASVSYHWANGNTTARAPDSKQRIKVLNHLYHINQPLFLIIMNCCTSCSYYKTLIFLKEKYISLPDRESSPTSSIQHTSCSEESQTSCSLQE